MPRRLTYGVVDMSPSATRFQERFNLANVPIEILPPGHPSLSKADANIGCAYNDKKTLNMIEKPVQLPGEGEVLVRVRATGICGTDIHFWKDGGIGPKRLTCECGAGHESAGEVVAVGPGVTEWKAGDRVALEQTLACGECQWCKGGAYNHCTRLVFNGSPPYHGTLTRFHIHPAAWLHRLPDNVSYAEGALCEPLVVALYGVERASVRLGDPIVICGAGPIGLMVLLCARAAGAAPIVITDVVASRLEFAKTLVPTVRTVLVGREDPAESSKKVKEAAGVGIKIAIECTGFESSISTAIYTGTCFIIGVGAEQQRYPMMYCWKNEIKIDFQYLYSHQYPKALRVLGDGLVDIKPLVTHQFPLARAIEAFETAADPTSGCIKVHIVDE